MSSGPNTTASRAAETEIMDARAYDPAELRANLADLRFLNRWMGGARLVAREVGRMMNGPAPVEAAGLRVLDVATGSGDIPAHLARWAAARGVELLAAGIDANPDVLDEARRYLASERSAARNGARVAAHSVHILRADALQLPHADRSFDIVVSSTFLHHLDDDSVGRALAEMKRVSRVGVVIVDLRRGRMQRACIWLLTRLLTRNRLTRHDGPLSVDRAFTPAELAAVASRAGLDGAAVSRSGTVRMVMRWRR